MAFYRRLLNENVYNKAAFHSAIRAAGEPMPKLPTFGHALAGMFAGWTVSVIAAPVEHIKARLQVQYAAKKAERLYTGPIDCAKKIVSRAVGSVFAAYRL